MSVCDCCLAESSIHLFKNETVVLAKSKTGVFARIWPFLLSAVKFYDEYDPLLCFLNTLFG